jgi:spore maturation protein CgeB
LKIVLFYHSLVSDWNHGNAHFLRGIVWELRSRGNRVDVYEPRDGWSMQNLLAEYGHEAVRDFNRAYPGLLTNRFDLDTLDLDQVLDGADLVLVHEWNDHELVRRIGEHRAATRQYRLFFHDTHHRSVTEPESMSRDLRHYDGVFAYGDSVRAQYLKLGLADHVWTWHEAADTRIFRPRAAHDECDVVWIGNWGDEERTAELSEFLFEPVTELSLRTVVYGVRYPEDARRMLAERRIEYRGWIANYRVPQLFAGAKATVHVPRRPYTQALRGVPTIRPFEAMACAIPLVSAPWEDSEGLFTAGGDYLLARDGAEMIRHLRALMNDPQMRRAIGEQGRATILARHTCAHRVDELFAIHSSLERTQKGEVA